MPTDDFCELILRFHAPDSGGLYPIEAWVDGGGLCVGKPILLSSDKLDECETSREYGVTLWSTLLTGLPDLNTILNSAAGSIPRVRLRIMLNEEDWAVDLHRIKWEFLLPSGHLPVGVNAASPVSRFIPLRSSIDSTAREFGLRILLAIASPSDLKDPFQPIDVAKEIETLFTALKLEIRAKQVQLTILCGLHDLPAQLRKDMEELNCLVINKPVTIESVDANLSDKHVLHLIAHGNFVSNQSVLMLEDEQGKLAAANPSREVLIDQWMSHKPRLIFLQSCLSDPKDKTMPMGGLASQFVQAGAPAVVAMRDLVGMTAARMFAAAFYQQLLLTGDADVAANSGRNAIFQASAGDWAIPVLYSRLRADQKLWEPEPLRRSIQALAKVFATTREVTQPFPVEVSVVRDIKVVCKQLDDPTSDTRMDAAETALNELRSSAKQNQIVVLVGGRGRAKSSLLLGLFVQLAHDADPSGRGPQPILVRLKDCNHSSNPTTVIETGWQTRLRDEGVAIEEGSVRNSLQSNALHLLVDADEDVGPDDLKKGFNNIWKFLAQAENRCALISMDQSAFKAEYFNESLTTVLIVQDLRPQTLKTFLQHKDGLTPETIQMLTGPLRDLAGVPWILSRILRFSSMEQLNLKSRFNVLARILQDQLGAISLAPGCGSLARALMESMAWQLHSRSAPNLQLAETYSLMSSVRGGRDFSLDQFRNSMITSRLLVESGPEGLRFGYNAAHAYFTACYLSNLSPSDRRERLLEIVSGLGSPERLRRWEAVLLLLAGRMDEPAELLRMLLELGFGEGEHLLLAARCLSEADATGKVIPEAIVNQLADSLIWWSHPQSGLQARSRQRAVDALGYMLSEDSTKALNHSEMRIAGHLLQLALHPLRPALEGSLSKRLDYSGVRLAAMTLLFRHQRLAERFWAQHTKATAFKDEINTLLHAWAKGDLIVLKSFLDAGKEKVMLAGVAVFALASWGSPESNACLKDRFFEAPVYEDVHWPIVDALIEMQASVVMEIVSDGIQRMKRSTPADALTKTVTGPIPDDQIQNMLSSYLIYPIGKLGGATLITENDPEIDFLKESLCSEDALIQGRALRAWAEILDMTRGAARQAQLLQVCHHILERRFDPAQIALGIDPPRKMNANDRKQLTRYALDALTHIGTEKSIEVLRDFYRRPSKGRPDPYDEMLRKSSWEMADKIRLRTLDQPQQTNDD